MKDRDVCPPAISLVQLFNKFLRFGLLAFGGPIAQIAMIQHELVEKEGWIAKPRFRRLLAVLQILPGPEAHELCVHMGILARGRIGGLLAGLGFMLPGFLLMLLGGWAYTTFVVGRAGLSGSLLGVQTVVLAIIVRAVCRIASHILTDGRLVALGLAAFAATLAEIPFWAILLAAAAANLLLAGATRLWAVVALFVLVGAGFASRIWWPAGADPSSPAAPATLIALFAAGLKGGLLTFGGAYTAIPYVRADTVGRGWLSDGTFLDGVALAGLLPAPLVIFATFVGYVAGGLGGALAITAGMFLPAFAFSMIFFERLEAIVENATLHRLLDGVAAAVVGIIGAAALQLAIPLFGRTPSLPVSVILVAFALALAWWLKGRWVAPVLVLGGAVVGQVALG